MQGAYRKTQNGDRLFLFEIRSLFLDQTLKDGLGQFIGASFYNGLFDQLREKLSVNGLSS
jgi:hypothetical protein